MILNQQISGSSGNLSLFTPDVSRPVTTRKTVQAWTAERASNRDILGLLEVSRKSMWWEQATLTILGLSVALAVALAFGS